MSETKKVSRAILLDAQGRVLLGKRVRNNGVGKWALIGGRPEEGENAEQAITREVREELGIDIVPSFYKAVHDQIPGEETPWLVSFFIAPIISSVEYKKDEISEIDYVSAEDLDQLDITFNHLEILKDFFSNDFKNWKR